MTHKREGGGERGGGGGGLLFLPSLMLQEVGQKRQRCDGVTPIKIEKENVVRVGVTCEKRNTSTQHFSPFSLLPSSSFIIGLRLANWQLPKSLESEKQLVCVA